MIAPSLNAPISRSVTKEPSPCHILKSETHHLHGTVSGHTLAVCCASVRIARLLKKAGIRVNEKDLVEASLCHDLGMILSHMWPVSSPPPRSREAVILNIADKAGSLADWGRFLKEKIRK